MADERVKQIKTAEISWDENGQPISTSFNDIYFSTASGLEETQYVFIDHNQLSTRWKNLKNNSIFTIGETGFGTGLNFLQTCQLWQNLAPSNSTLHYISIEKFPLSKQDLSKALQLWLSLKPLAETLLNNYTLCGKGFYRLHIDHNIQLTLIIDDAVSALESLQTIPKAGEKINSLECYWSPYKLEPNNRQPGKVDAWFLDGFAPAKNPQMWSSELFTNLAKLSGEHTTFATFTAAGIVKRGLEQVGFDVKKAPGFGRKREMLFGEFKQSHFHPKHHYKPSPSWHLQTLQLPLPKTIAVIGAGLAGAHSANALARAGFMVTVFDQGNVAAGASGNPQGALYTKLSASEGVLGEFNLASYIYAFQHYQNLHMFTGAGEQCGLLQLATDAKLTQQYITIAKEYPDICEWLTPEQASTQSGIPIEFGALYFPHSGWLAPVLVCKKLLEHKNIQVHTQCKVSSLQQHQSWHLYGEGELNLGAFDAVVIACANTAQEFEQCKLLTTKAIRGQVTLTQANGESKALKAVLCSESYIAPAVNNSHCLGATFTLHNNSPQPEQADTQTNLTNSAALSPALTGLSADSKNDRVSFRCTTPDYLPIVGPAPIESLMLERFAKYRQNFKYTIDEPGAYWPGLYLNLGHGSRGLTYTPIAAQTLVSLITGAPLPLSQSMMLNIHSARFLMRDISRNRL